MDQTTPRVTEVAPTYLAAVIGEIPFADLPREISKRLSIVYNALKAGLATQQGHNVVVYRMREGHPLVECAVQVDGPFTSTEEVVCTQTPAGRAATLTHIGPYRGLPEANRHLSQWCREQGLPGTGVIWEVYGDWEEDESRLRTDVFHGLR